MFEDRLPLVVADEEQCTAMAQRVQEVNPPPASEEEVRYEIPDEVMSTCLGALVAICHQTSPHNAPRLRGVVNGKLLHAYDYLYQKWIQTVEGDLSLMLPASLASLRGEDIARIFCDEQHGELLRDPTGRAALLNDMGRKMEEQNLENLDGLYERSGAVLAGKYGLIEQLSLFDAYGRDPVQKKKFFFLALMMNQGYWTYRDPENLCTPVDYHEVRGHLRYGTVKVLSDALREKLLRGLEVTQEEDIAIRRAVFDAIMHVAQGSSRTPNDLHYFFWNVFRNCCRREETHCHECVSHPGFPERYHVLSPDRCVFAGSCASVGQPAKLQDHIVDTDLY